MGDQGLSLVDGSTVSLPASEGSDWRLHARYEPARGRFPRPGGDRGADR